MRMVALAVAVVLVLLAAFAVFVVTRPVIETSSSDNSSVVIRCEAAASSADACRAWGDAILAEGAPSTTFEMDDLAQLRIRRPVFGYGSPCEVAYIVTRYPDDPVWHEAVPCVED